ncbi:tetratricopeptide repeat protein [Herminiimonas contaminans]|jgi:CheY-like chemotaxis protein/predicted Zn-dependent protease|uniref:Response regulator n=1 Tax=Herminiimonas contaminans TaxID=1111140 RepID=A0ABS0EVU6_9BURK|nr:tetratricopeptide repeat protein [Herminiimonas contaminans]MBF8178950.1 response regulator [Herminiimonas contaminans]
MATILNTRLARLRALVVDDMQTMRQNIRTQLGQLGIEQVDQSATPNDAIKRIRNTNYDVIICDYNLNKETNGQQVLEYLRSQKLLSPTAMFFMVTAESSYDSVASAAEFQPDAYMVKPLTGGKIADRLERLLDRQQALKPITDRLQMKDLAGAIAECDTVLAAEPKWIVDILKIKGSSALELGNIEQARATYNKALTLRNDLVWARLGLARCDQAAGQLEQAKKLVNEVLETNVQFVGAYDLLAQIAEAQGNEEAVLDAFNKSYAVIPSARRSRLMGDAAYRVGNLEQAKQAFNKALTHTRGSLTAQASDALSLAQVQVDIGEAADALAVLSAAAQDHQDDPYFAARQATIAAQAFARLGDMNSAQAAFASAKELADGIRADIHTLTLAKAAFCVGLDEEGARIVAKAIKADHENTRLVAFARRVLQDTGNEALIEKVVEESISEGALIVEQATQLMRAGQFDESLAKLEEALTATPENTGVLLAAAQLHLLWMSQKGLDRNYVERVNAYLAQLDVLMPNSERVAKMYRFLRETLVKASVEA